MIVFTYSCNNDYLDEEIYGSANDTNIWKDKTDIQQAITSAVSKIDSKWGYYTSTFLRMEDGATNYFVGGGDFVNFSQWRTSYPGGLDWALWTPLWESIYYSNLVLDRIDIVPNLTPEEKKKFEGQARFFRAFNYYFAQSNYGGVPIVASASDKRTAIPQSTREEVRQFIENDLIVAANLLPNKADVQAEGKLSRPSKQAALGLLARLYINWDGRADRWQKTVETCNLIINNPSGLGLESTGTPYSKIFAIDNENNKEIVYAIEHNTSNIDSGVFLLNLQFASAPDMKYPNGSRFWGGGNLSLSWNFYNDEFTESGDLRKNQILAKYINTSGNLVEVPWGQRLVAKYPLDPYNITTHIGGNDQPIIRYADIILMKAEALNQDNDLAGAITLVNDIRHRAGLGDLASPHKDSFDNLNEYIYHERRREFFCEGLGRTDMIRFKLKGTTNNEFLKWVASKGVPETGDALNKYLVYPFELIALTNNKGLKQNPGYTN